MKVTSKELTTIREILKKSGADNVEVKTNKEGSEIFIKVDEKYSLIVFTAANIFESIAGIKVNVELFNTGTYETTLSNGETFYVKYFDDDLYKIGEFQYSGDGSHWTVIPFEYTWALSNAFKYFTEAVK